MKIAENVCRVFVLSVCVCVWFDESVFPRTDDHINVSKFLQNIFQLIEKQKNSHRLKKRKSPKLISSKLLCVFLCTCAGSVLLCAAVVRLYWMKQKKKKYCPIDWAQNAGAWYIYVWVYDVWCFIGDEIDFPSNGQSHRSGLCEVG